MLLTTSYGLNNSHTKRIHVGLQTTSDGVFVPVVKLNGNYAEGIHFDAESWLRFQKSMKLMKEYLGSHNRSRPDPISIDNISTSFTTSYGARSILVAYKENEAHTTGNTHAEEETALTPASKKRKPYGICIVMQQTTFIGLENIVKCIDAQLKRLQSLAKSVNECARYLIKEIELNLPSGYIDRDIVKLTLKPRLQWS
ncbi:hypothetical protein DMN91_007958 [Ooceraea biroi]|uniref:Uncharacterized protein n=1 Tax=Ooceraea biroi TaxID=2015173 RepID=A0A3L8DGF8_OOCBI|nr:uncharacterized protein LOC113561372 [Ooceraea biroi]RLU19401.1 hypothetical protein DMN91_007958 [Ooceraea biroi]